MSMAQYDDINDICCEQMEEETKLLEVNTTVESEVSTATHYQNVWLEEVLADYEQEQLTENEMEYALFYS